VRGEGNVPCENCGRMFSTLSNKERHKREHCHTMNLGQDGNVEQLVEIKKEVVEEVIGSVKDKDELRCPILECGEEFARSVHLKRHLSSQHDIQNPLIMLSDNVKTEASEENEASTNEDTVKVPPLIIKLQSPPSPNPTTPVTDNTKYSITNTAHEKKKVIQKDQHMVDLVEESSAEETDEDCSKVEIIDENTVENIEATSAEKVPMGIIINETSEAISETNYAADPKLRNDDLTIEDEIENSTID